MNVLGFALVHVISIIGFYATMCHFIFTTSSTHGSILLILFGTWQLAKSSLREYDRKYLNEKQIKEKSNV